MVTSLKRKIAIIAVANLMSKVMTFFRACPVCGRRFETRFMGKKPKAAGRRPEEPGQPAEGKEWVRDRSSSDHYVGILALDHSIGISGGRIDGGPLPVTAAFEYSYKCNHCGHEWCEEKVEER